MPNPTRSVTRTLTPTRKPSGRLRRVVFLTFAMLVPGDRTHVSDFPFLLEVMQGVVMQVLLYSTDIVLLHGNLADGKR